MSLASKADWRSKFLAARRAVVPELRQAEAEQLCNRLDEVVEGVDTAAAYVPIGAEPGSLDMLDLLAQRCRTVLLPVARTTSDGEHLPLQWGRYIRGQLTPAQFGLRQPGEPWLPASALAEVDLVLVPALAVDRRGVRLGRGGGFYDRSLALCRPGTRLVAVVRDSEVVGELPGEPHDVRMTHALTPAGGLIALNGGSST